MKNFTKILAIAIVGFAFSASAFAQSTASASATATIITPISITKNLDLVFGNIANGASSGTVTISNAGARSFTGGVTLVPGIAPQAAQFTVSGSGSFTYSVTLPADGDVTISSGSNTMAVDGFTSNSTGAIGESFNVGAVLKVGANQATGDYSGTFDVKVQYN